MKNKEKKTRRKFSTEEKQRILSESIKPGENMISVAKKHGLPVHTLYAWKSKMKTKHVFDKLPPLENLDLTLFPKLARFAQDENGALRETVRDRDQLVVKLAMKIEALEARLSKYE